MRKVRLLFFTVGLFFSFSSLAQSVAPSILNTTGGTYIFGYYRFEWSFGEATAIETLSNTTSNLVVTTGVLQPGTNTPATVNNTLPWDRDEIKIFPNPTPDQLEIDFFSKQQGKITMKLFNELGQQITLKQFDYYGTGRIEKMSLGNLSSAQYFLNIMLTPTGKSVAKNGTFKVQKIK
jgi:hypothetical protein